MKVVTGLQCAELVHCVEKSLGRLNFAYFKNEGKHVTEYEVKSPCSFRIIVEDDVASRPHFFVDTGEKDRSTIEVRQDLSVHDSETDVRSQVEIFLQDLTVVLPRKPWQGLGFFKSISEKAKWKELSEL